MIPNFAKLSETYLSYFKGREDFLGAHGHKHYYPMTGNLKNGRLHDHILGLQTFGMYVLTKTSHCHFICLDIDIPKDKLSEINFKIPQIKFDYLKIELTKILDALIKELNLTEYNILLEDSGGRGYHIWIFFETPLEGYKALGICNILKTKYEINCETFPKQSKLTEKRRYGNMIKLPLGIHKFHQQQSRFFTFSNEEIHFFDSFEENINHLNRIKKIPVSEIESVLENSDQIFIEEEYEEEEGLSETSKRLIFKKDLPKIFGNCQALNTILEKTNQGISLGHIEAFHLTNTLLSIQDTESDILEYLNNSYKDSYRETYAKAEIEKIRSYKPASCKTLHKDGICKAYCQRGLEKRNEDPLLTRTSPLSLWLDPITEKSPTDSKTLLDQISAIENIKLAYTRLKEYQGQQEGVFYDLFDFEMFENSFEENIQLIAITLQNKSSFPEIQYEIVKVPKKVDDNGEVQWRGMAYSSVFNQVIIQSVLNIISYSIEESFQNTSYGYRLNITNPKSVEIFEPWTEKYPQFRNNVLSKLREPKISYYLCCDIKGYYDNVQKNILSTKLRGIISDDYIYGIINKAIEAYSFEGKNNLGLPQGPAFARPLANLYLNDFDKAIVSKCTYYFRYVDDFFILFENIDQAKETLEWVVKSFSALGLELASGGDKEATITRADNEQTILDKMDDLQYSIFEELNYLPFLSQEDVRHFFKIVSDKTILSEEVNTLNKVLPSYIYIYSKEQDFTIESHKELASIIVQLTESKLFFPRKFSKVFSRIVEILIKAQEDIPSFFDHLEDSLKVHFLLKLYNKFKYNSIAYAEIMTKILCSSAKSSDKYLLGISFSIIVKHSEFFEIKFDNHRIIALIQSNNYEFLAIKFFSNSDYFNLTIDQKKQLSTYFKPKMHYLVKKAFFIGLKDFRSFAEVDSHLFQNLLSDNYFLLQSDCCHLISKLEAKNSLFHEIIKFLNNAEPQFKKFIIDFLGQLIFNKYKTAEDFQLESLIIIYETGTDSEIKERIYQIVARFRNQFPADTSLLTNFNRIDSYDECLLYRSITDSDHFIEIIPYYKLGYSDPDKFRKFSNSIILIRNFGLTGKTTIEYKAQSESIFLESKLPPIFKELKSCVLNWENQEDCFAALLLIRNIYLKAHKYFNIFNKFPPIQNNNIRIINSNYEIIFTKIGGSLEGSYVYNGKHFNNSNEHEIGRMCSSYLSDLFFSDKISQTDFNKKTKIGISLFLSYLINRLNFSPPSVDRLNYLIDEISKFRNSNSEVTYFYYSEYLRIELFKSTAQSINWKTTSSAMKQLYESFAIVFGKINFREITFRNKTLFNIRVPYGLHVLSVSLINLNLNLENILKDLSDRPATRIFKTLNLYLVFCIELISAIKSILRANNATPYLPERSLAICFDGAKYFLPEPEVKNLNKLIKILNSSEITLFNETVPFSLKEISILCVLSSSNLTFTDSIVNISPKIPWNNRNYDKALHLFLISVPAMENQIFEIVTKINFSLSRNFYFPDEFNPELPVLESSLENNLSHLVKIRKQFKTKRYTRSKSKMNTFGNSITIKNFLRKDSKVLSGVMKSIPLTTLFPLQNSKYSFDRFKTKVINLVIPNEIFNQLIKNLKLRRSLKYMYSEKLMIFFDLFFLLIFYSIVMFITFLYDHKPINPVDLQNNYLRIMTASLWPLRQIFMIPTLFLVLKVFTWDLYYWFKPYRYLIELFKYKK